MLRSTSLQLGLLLQFPTTTLSDAQAGPHCWQHAGRSWIGWLPQTLRNVDNLHPHLVHSGKRFVDCFWMVTP